MLQLYCTLQYLKVLSGVVKGFESGPVFLQSSGSGRWIQEFKGMPGHLFLVTYCLLEKQWIFKVSECKGT